ncbi:response regulator transcription factor [Amycolatopsis sp. NPDC051373]|uniref:response regulator transcription factor n=1 Tax=Amycolatopsis sp. NPDC051373 TaxID=3155801 RepID=UPI00345002E3
MHADGAELLAVPGDLGGVVLLDLNLPGLDGLEVLRRLRARAPRPRVVMLTTIGRASDIRRALAEGADGFVLEDSTGEELAAAVRAAHAGMTAVSAAVAAELGVPAEPFTPRERDVLALLGRGLSNRDIAAELGLAERTVKVHAGNCSRSFRWAAARRRRRRRSGCWAEACVRPPRDRWRRRGGRARVRA